MAGKDSQEIARRLAKAFWGVEDKHVPVDAWLAVYREVIRIHEAGEYNQIGIDEIITVACEWMKTANDAHPTAEAARRAGIEFGNLATGLYRYNHLEAGRLLKAIGGSVSV